MRTPKTRIPRAGIPKVGQTRTGTLPGTEIPKPRIPKSGIPKTGILEAGIPKLGIPKMGRFRGPLSQTPFRRPLIRLRWRTCPSREEKHEVDPQDVEKLPGVVERARKQHCHPAAQYSVAGFRALFDECRMRSDRQRVLRKSTAMCILAAQNRES